MFSEPIGNLAAELLANRNLLSALAGPGIVVTVDAEGGARPVRLTSEDLIRLLVNLVKNAAEAIPSKMGRGHIQISLRERGQGGGAPGAQVPEMLVMAVEDDGPGIPIEVLEKVFDSGFSTHARNAVDSGGWPVGHRGLGLAISRSIVEASGGRVAASNRAQGGARIEIELPVRNP
jgi:signal transduction histidine kinase